MLLSEFFRNETIWWKKNVRIKNGRWIRDPKVDVYLETDTSKAGWGANLNGKTTGGRWSESESVLHINDLEIMAIKFALQSLCQNMKNTQFCIRSDNSVAVSYIDNQGGSILSLSEEAKSILLWCDIKKIIISAVHIAGKK